MDARPVDTAVIPPDAPAGVNFMSNEGGEVRFEYVRFADGTASSRVIAFFEGKDDVDFHAYPTIPGCTVLVDDQKWPTSQPKNRTYVDIGQLTLTNGTKVLNVPKATISTDELQRVHGVGNWYSHPAGANDGATFSQEKSAYDVIFTGSPTFPAQVIKNAIFMPADFALTTPMPANTPLVAGQDMTVSWNVVDSQAPPSVPKPWSVVGFIDASHGAVALCIQPMNTGSITVPAAIIDAVRTASPAGGFIIRQTFHHQVRELTNGTTIKNRRIDMIGVWCHANTYSVP